MKEIPRELHGRPFTVAEAADLGFGEDLGGKRFRQLFRGVHITAATEMTVRLWLRAALLILPPDAVASHLTALRLWGLELQDLWPLHFSTNTSAQVRRRGIVLHRRRARLRRRTRHRIPCTAPERTLVDCAAIQTTAVEIVQAAEHLIHAKHLTLDALRTYVAEAHLDGVLRARRLLVHVRERVESPMETLVRLALVFARLPEPDTNPDVLDHAGRFIARCDMVYWRWKVIVEYDGAWHERSKKQRARDRTRREALERSGWTVIVVFDTDLVTKQAIVWRVYVAMRDHGYDGPRPHFNATWTRWFA